MVFESFNDTETNAGKPTKQELFKKLKNDFDDHETRIENVEAAAAAFIPLEFFVGGAYYGSSPAQEVLFERIKFNLTLTAVRLVIQHAGTSGATEIDILYKRGSGAWTSVFTTKPSVDFSAGDYAVSTNAILAVTDLLAGDLVRLDITSAQLLGEGFLTQLEYTKT